MSKRKTPATEVKPASTAELRREGRLPTDAEIAAAQACVGLRHVELDAHLSTVRFRRPGIELNLGAIGKGYALDRVAPRTVR